MAQQSITIRTLADLRANGYGLNAYCEACGHRRDLNLDDLIRRLGEGFDIIGNPQRAAPQTTQGTAG
jgi:hypothetical protein